MVLVVNDRFNCKNGILPETDSEGCNEISYLNFSEVEMAGSFKTPSLRNLKLTAPYMHDGRFSSLKEVLKHYNKFDKRPALGHKAHLLKDLNLGEGQLDQLEKFLVSLNSPVSGIK